MSEGSSNQLQSCFLIPFTNALHEPFNWWNTGYQILENEFMIKSWPTIENTVMFHINYNSTEHNGMTGCGEDFQKADPWRFEAGCSWQRTAALWAAISCWLSFVKVKLTMTSLPSIPSRKKLLESEALMGTGREESLQCPRLIYRLISSLRGVLIELPERRRAEFVSLCRNTDERMFWKRLTFLFPLT